MFNKKDDEKEEAAVITNKSASSTSKRSDYQSSDYEADEKGTKKNSPLPQKAPTKNSFPPKDGLQSDEDKAVMNNSFRSHEEYKSEAIPMKDAKGGGQLRNGQSASDIRLAFEVTEDTQTKKWNVYPTAYSTSTSEKWVVECNTKSDADAYKKGLLDGKLKSPADAPHSYGSPRKGAHGNMLYVKV